MLRVNTLWPCDAIGRHRSGSVLVQVMAWWLTANHYLNQCWLIISRYHWYSSEGHFTRYLSHQSLKFRITHLKLHSKFHKGQWVNVTPWNARYKHILTITSLCCQLSSDQMYLTAIQNMVMEHVKSRKVVDPMDKASANWDQEEGVDQAFFTDIRSLLMRVSNCEMAMICSNWLVKELPMGRKIFFYISLSLLAADIGKNFTTFQVTPHAGCMMVTRNVVKFSPMFMASNGTHCTAWNEGVRRYTGMYPFYHVLFQSNSEPNFIS